MKINNKFLKTIFILIIICLSNTLTNCRKTKLSRKLRKSKHKMKSKTKVLGFIWSYLKSKLTDPVNILYFTLGVLSVFVSAFETLYYNIKPYVDKLSTCVHAVIDAFKAVAGTLEEIKQGEEELKKNSEFVKFETNIDTPEKQTAYCEKVKEENEQNFKDAELKKHDRDYDILGLISLWFKQNVSQKFASSQEYCERVYDLKEKNRIDIFIRYKSLENYMKQCIFFHGLDCKTMQIEKGLWDFVYKAYKYGKVIWDIKKCLFDELQKNPATALSFTQSATNDIIAGAIGFVANIFTLGTWGGVKGGYYLVQLGIDLYQAWETMTEHLAFNIGKVIGKGIMIAKSIILGRRKLKNKKH